MNRVLGYRIGYRHLIISAQRIASLAGILFLLFSSAAMCYADNDALSEESLDSSYDEVSFEKNISSEAEPKIGTFERIKRIVIGIIILIVAVYVLKLVFPSLPSWTAKGIGFFLWLIFVGAIIDWAFGIKLFRFF